MRGLISELKPEQYILLPLYCRMKDWRENIQCCVMSFVFVCFGGFCEFLCSVMFPYCPSHLSLCCLAHALHLHFLLLTFSHFFSFFMLLPSLFLCFFSVSLCSLTYDIWSGMTSENEPFGLTLALLQLTLYDNNISK